MFRLKTLKSKFKFSVSEYNKIVAFINNFCQGFGIKIQRPDNPTPDIPVIISLDPDVLPSADCGEKASYTDDLSSPVVNGDLPAASLWTWQAGGDNGFDLDLYCLVTKPAQSSTYHDLRRCRLTVSKDGLVVKAAMMPDGLRIKA